MARPAGPLGRIGRWLAQLTEYLPRDGARGPVFWAEGAAQGAAYFYVTIQYPDKKAYAPHGILKADIAMVNTLFISRSASQTSQVLRNASAALPMPNHALSVRDEASPAIVFSDYQ
uniref:Uncharacterized protein n=1 Tax=Candidatus Kentrum sp. LFY TaxID=2126342 RepID=A0A450UAV3_9GAMM|nr:MAG: hypothetical protein BECKLFY1418A_GA0070994_100713 [Candidatus Kentron sp. LFY]